MTPKLILAFGSYRYCKAALLAAEIRSLAAPDPRGLDASERADAMVFEADIDAAQEHLEVATETYWDATWEEPRWLDDEK